MTASMLLASPALAYDESPPGLVCDAWASSAAAWPAVSAAIKNNYAYQDRVADLDAVLSAYKPAAGDVNSASELGRHIETMSYLFRDSHFNVNPAGAPVRAYTPSASDLWVERDQSGRYMMVDVQRGGQADQKGIRPGWELTKIDGVLVDVAVSKLLQPMANKLTAAQREYAANVMLTGVVSEDRAFTFLTPTGQQDIVLPSAYDSLAQRGNGLLSATMHGDVLNVRFKNSLGNNSLISQFDGVMKQHANKQAVIIDLRDTPGGGNTTVARGILGHFVAKAKAFQQHNLISEQRNFGVARVWNEFVQPRGTYFSGPIVVLAGRRTGSMGEGIAIGFDAATAAHSIGTPLADLLGDSRSNKVADGCLNMKFGWERLSHIDGTPREDWTPDTILPEAEIGPNGADAGLDAALKHLQAQGIIVR